MPRLYLTRHGETQWNLEGRMQGNKESNLTEKGVRQALKLGKRLKDTNIDIVYSSPSNRAVHSAELIVGNRDIQIIKVNELIEMHFGIWEGLSFDVIQQKYGEQYKAFWETPHLLKDFPGETFEKFKIRVVGAINKIIEENSDKDILIVAHALVVKFIMSYFEDTPLEKLFDDRIIQQTSLSIVEINNNQFNILKYGDIEHYSLELD
jgi:phosphoserine phosphatase